MAQSAQAAIVPWAIKYFEADGKNPTRIEIHFSPEYIRTLWQREPVSEPATRSGYESSDEEDLILDDVVTYEDASIFVLAWLVPAKKPGYFHIRVEVKVTQRLTRNARVILYWDGYTYIVRLRAGEMLFEDISTPDFSHLNGNLPSDQLRMTFELEENSKNGKH
jgi:hypothetical protein